MSDRIDHAATARAKAAFAMGEGPVRRFGFLLNALVHAVLALVEQQRVANLLAIRESSLIGHDDIENSLYRFEDREDELGLPGLFPVGLHPGIVRALGINNDEEKSE